MRQIAPFGTLLETYSLDGVIFKVFPRRGCFVRKLHGVTKQIASETGEFAVREGIATGNGDLAMHGEPPVKLASSTAQEVGSGFLEMASASS